MYWIKKTDLKEIPALDVKYSYKVHEKTEDLHVLLDFLHENYHHNNAKFRFRYSSEHLEYFLRSGGWVYMYSEKIPNVILGVAAYRKIILNDSSQGSEVDFLCVRSNIRNLKLASNIIDKIINILTAEGIYCSFFTGIVKRDIDYYSKKKIYLYILNYQKLRGIGYIPIHDSSRNLHLENDSSIRECKDEDYSGIIDDYNGIFRKEPTQKENCFIDFISDGKFFRFIKIDIISTRGDIINSVVLYYCNCSIDKYINGISYLLKETHEVDMITLYEPFEEPNVDAFDTGNYLYYYSYNRAVNAAKSSMNPI